MQQSLHLLQAPVLELRALVQQEMQVNPVLEDQPDTEDVREEESTEDWDAEFEELKQQDEEWKEYFSQSHQKSYSGGMDDEKRQFLFDSQVEPSSLSDHLIEQLIFSTRSEEDLRAGEEIIGNLDESGFLQVPLNEIAIAAQTDLKIVERMLEKIQSFHPSGVAARDLRETLLIQLRQKGKEGELEWNIVDQSLEELGKKRFSELAKKYGTSLERIQEAAHYIGSLQPKPGAAFAPDDPHSIIQPEAAIVKVGGEWVVQMNHDPVPKLRISNTYRDLLSKANEDVHLKDYLKEKIRSGKFLIRCLHQRQDTIEQILKEVVIHQTDFLESGVKALKPLTMSHIADIIGVHETTVSRAISGKYVQTPWGIFPIKFFFTYGYETSEGESMANTSIKEAISELIEKENKKKPLSDSEIVKILKDQGIELARRTVAKYRTELKILPSNLRRIL